jgi:hypothetical protein
MPGKWWWPVLNGYDMYSETLHFGPGLDSERPSQLFQQHCSPAIMSLDFECLRVGEDIQGR